MPRRPARARGLALEREGRPKALPVGAARGRRRNHVHAFHEPYAVLREGEFYAAVRVGARAQTRAAVLHQRRDERAGERLALVKQTKARGRRERAGLGNQLEAEAERLVIAGQRPLLRHDESLGATGEDLPVRLGRLAAGGAPGGDRFEPLLPQVLLELRCRELQRIRLAAVADDG